MTTKSTKFQTKYNYKPSKGKKMLQDTQTVPDMHLSLQQLLMRAADGTLDNIAHNEGQYFGNEVIPQFDDIQESVEYLRAKREELQQINDSIEAKIKEKEQEAQTQEVTSEQPQE